MPDGASVTSIAHDRLVQTWCQEQIERELVDLITAEQIRRDAAGHRRVSRHVARMTAPFVLWMGDLDG